MNDPQHYIGEHKIQLLSDLHCREWGLIPAGTILTATRREPSGYWQEHDFSGIFINPEHVKVIPESEQEAT